MKKYKYILGIDPSGSYNEGKGTTGWCILDNNNKVLETNTLIAGYFKSANAYWQAHINLIDAMRTKYGPSLALSVEDYLLYESRAQAQVNSHMETVQLIGIIKHHCYVNNLPLYMRPAVAVKKRWSDAILAHKGILLKSGRRYVLPETYLPTCEHQRDAIRHAVHCNMFEIEE